ncbi:MAG: efflux RND transporter periplasmic adaptor subunit [Bdellovibrionales bacterium]|nr:efflux RND transporter periplasmic adaptor subunit [Bdellovibrionales bacterium]
MNPSMPAENDLKGEAEEDVESMSRESLDHWSRRLLRQRGFLFLAILSAGLIGYLALVFLQAEPPKIESRRVAAPVSVSLVTPQSTRAIVRGFGTVAASQELTIRPEVSGVVIELSPQMFAGGRIPTGDLLFRIDPRDYEIALQGAKAQLEKALFELKLEEGNQIVAEREWRILKKNAGEVSELSQELALRKPHLRDKQAQVEAARSRVKKAELDLERTQVTAPFDIAVLDESVEIGRYVGPQENIAMVVSTREFEIEVQVPRSELRWLPSLVNNESSSLPATIVQRLKDGLEYRKEGRAVKLLSDVDSAGRMAKVRVLVDDPLTVSSEHELPLLVGTYVEVLIQGKEVEGVYAIPQRAVREGGVIWTVSDQNTLQSYKVEIVLSAPKTVYARGANLPSALKVITNALPGALEGMPVAIQEGKAL